VYGKFRSAALSVITIALCMPGLARPQTVPEAADFKVTLLGTGSPFPSVKRFGPAVLVQTGKHTLLFDAGRGVAQRLVQANVRLGAVEALFITHLHSDHIVGIPDLWLTGWLPLPVASRKGPFRVYGPAGTKAMMENLEKAYDWDIRIRVADQKLSRDDVAVAVSEFSEGVIYDTDGVKVTAFEVDHGDLIKPAYGFRVDYDGRSIVVSGDTRFNENLIKRATGTDLLIHQVAMAQEGLLRQSKAVQAILAHHTKPDEAGVVFTRAHPRLAVFYHFSLQGGPGFPPPTEKDVVELTRKSYSGPLVVGEDLMAFEIGKNGVTTKQ
jgi:ribonuclease Z